MLATTCFSRSRELAQGIRWSRGYSVTAGFGNSLPACARFGLGESLATWPVMSHFSVSLSLVARRLLDIMHDAGPVECRWAVLLCLRVAYRLRRVRHSIASIRLDRDEIASVRMPATPDTGISRSEGTSCLPGLMNVEREIIPPRGGLYPGRRSTSCQPAPTAYRSRGRRLGAGRVVDRVAPGRRRGGYCCCATSLRMKNSPESALGVVVRIGTRDGCGEF